MMYPNIWRSIEYIESHLKEDLLLEEIAEHVGYSLFHFIRKFNAVVKMSPKDYIMRRKLTEAMKALQEDSVRILDVALDYGFGSHEAFSRAFKRVFNITPQSYKKTNEAQHRSLEAMDQDYFEFLSENTFKLERVLMENVYRGYSLSYDQCTNGLLEMYLSNSNLLIFSLASKLLFHEAEGDLVLHLNWQQACIQVAVEKSEDLLWMRRYLLETASFKSSVPLNPNLFGVEKQKDKLILFIPLMK